MIDLLNTSAVSLILAGIGWFVRKYYTHHLENKKKKNEESYRQGLRAIAQVYNSMDVLSETHEITRVLLLEVSNGGNMPRPGSRMFASAINVKHEDQGAGREVLRRYEKISIDDHYINMCVQIGESSEPFKMQVTEDNNSLLASFYKSEGITYAEVYHIFTDRSEEKMFIMSISTSQENESFTRDGLRAIIKSEINIIRSEFMKYRSV